MKSKFILISIAFIILYSCTNYTKEQPIKSDMDSLSLLNLYNFEGKDNLKIYLQKIDSLLKCDNNVLNNSNIGLLERKLFILNCNNDTLNPLLADSLYQEILAFYRKERAISPHNPIAHINLAKMYNYPQALYPDSVYFYYSKVIVLCDSILKTQPYENETYRIKVYTMLVLGKESEVKKMIEKDRNMTKKNKSTSIFLEKLHKEIETSLPHE